MIPIMIANKANIKDILIILFIKFILGLFFGVLIDIFYKTKLSNNINEICEQDDCHCGKGVIKSSIIHSAKILLFILVINILLNLIVDKDMLSNFMGSNSVLSPILSSIIGLVPNCVSSILITELYLEGILSLGSCVSGLLCGSGLGLLILFKQNRNFKENFLILVMLLLFSSISGIVLDIII